MREHVRLFIKQCDTCQKTNPIEYKINTKAFTTGTYSPFERVNVDHIGPFVEDEYGNSYVLVIIDCFSRYINLYPVRDTQASTAATALLHHCGSYGTPCQLLSDQGSAFVNQLIAEFLNLMGTEQVITMAYSKEENSIVERSNKEVNRWTCDILYDKKLNTNKWSMQLPFVARIHNASPVATIGCAPAEIIFGNAINLDRGIFIPAEERNTSDDIPLTEWMHDRVSYQDTIIKIAQQKQKQHEDAHLTANPVQQTEFPVGSHVLVSQPLTTYGQRRPNKFSTYKKGPYKVLKQIDRSYDLLNLTTGKTENKSMYLLTPYHYDAHRTNPETMAMKDYPSAYVVEEIRAHQGAWGRHRAMTFTVKWVGYDDTTTEPWASLKTNQKLKEYLTKQGKERLMPNIL